ncbi:MAG: DNA cytosine methyltransferase [Pseudomonadota bacterium]|nr:DNA cytosine methyltransferase [Pseudomonadota bacterium]
MKFVSLFTGLGGLDVGFVRAGAKALYANDVDQHAVAALNANHSNLSECSVDHDDIRNLSAAKIENRSSARRGDVDLIVGGPPCQSWSSAGRQRGLQDPRGQLVLDYIRIANELDVRWLVFENVRGLLTARGPEGNPGGALQHFRNLMLKHGFQTTVQLLNAADYGVPQRRVRLIIIGYRAGDEPSFPEPTHSKNPDEGLNKFAWVSLRECLAELEPITEDEIIRPSASLATQLAALPDGTGVRSAGKRETTRPGGHWGYKQGAFIAAQNLPARTVTASSQQDWVRDPVYGLRKLTPRECAAIQSFPKDWKIPGSRAVKYRLIGNAVPPLLAERVAEALFKHSTQFDHRMLDLDQGRHQELLPLPNRLSQAIEYTIRDNMKNGESRISASQSPDGRGMGRGNERQSQVRKGSHRSLQA